MRLRLLNPILNDSKDQVHKRINRVIMLLASEPEKLRQ